MRSSVRCNFRFRFRGHPVDRDFGFLNKILNILYFPDVINDDVTEFEIVEIQQGFGYIGLLHVK